MNQYRSVRNTLFNTTHNWSRAVAEAGSKARSIKRSMIHIVLWLASCSSETGAGLVPASKGFHSEAHARVT